jgi:hypothetical protein
VLRDDHPLGVADHAPSRDAHLRAAGRVSAVARGATACAIVAFGALQSTQARGEERKSAAADLTAPPPATASPSTTPPPSTEPAKSPAPWTEGDAGDLRAGLDPFPSSGQYLSFGVAFHSESLLDAGDVCPGFATEGCVLGAGGGISFGAAFRTSLYSLGAVYEASFHDSNNIFQRGVLQQARGEWRLRPRAWTLGESINPFVGAGGGLALYGDNWRAATFGGAGHATIGTEFDLGVKVTAVFAISYRLLYFRTFEDAIGERRPSGIVQLLGLQLGIELHDPL